MTSAPRLHAVLLAAAATALLAPGAAADEGALTAEVVGYSGGATQSGTAVAFYLTDGPLTNGSQPTTEISRPLLSVGIQAQRLEALQVESRYLLGPEVAGVRQPVDDPTFDRDAPPRRTVLDEVQADLVEQQEDFQLHVLPAGPAGVAYTASTEAGEFLPHDALVMHAGRFGEPRAADEDERAAGSPLFWKARIDQPVIVHDDQASRIDVEFKGDLVLELVGGTFEAQDPDEQATLESGVWTAPVAGLPLPGVETQRNVLLRMFLQNATVRIAVHGGATDVLWGATDVHSDQAGESLLEGAVGQISSDGEALILSDERFRLPAGTHLDFTPQKGAPMALAVRPATVAGTGRDASGGNGPSTYIAGAAILALVAAAGLGLLRRLTAVPDLRQMELALESQRYGRAARLAKSILRSRPGLEDAVLGRAIALSKSGRAGAAISEIHEHLATRGASDGSLHYVLGLSFLDVGRVAEARIALGEAVARTPALRADVAARLGHPFGSQPMTLREVHGYA